MAVDVVTLSVEGHRLVVLVHRRPRAPAEGELALPGVFLTDQEEPPEDAAVRALQTKAGLLTHGRLQLISVENHPARHDPRGWVMTMVFLTVVPWWELVEATAENAGVRLLEVMGAPRDSEKTHVALKTLAGHGVSLAFDHGALIGKSLAWLRNELFRSDVCLDLVPEEFTVRQLQDVYETILGSELYRTSFRRRLAEGQNRLIEPTGTVLDSDPRKPELYRRVPLPVTRSR